jgi:hypothetical protein
VGGGDARGMRVGNRGKLVRNDRLGSSQEIEQTE